MKKKTVISIKPKFRVRNVVLKVFVWLLLKKKKWPFLSLHMIRSEIFCLMSTSTGSHIVTHVHGTRHLVGFGRKKPPRQTHANAPRKARRRR